jgi:hypothetical protein
MALGLSPPVGSVGMDRQLFDIITEEDGKKIITALTPIARRSLLEYHGDGLVTSLNWVAEFVFSEGVYTNDVKGRFIEKYIITMVELLNRFSFKFRKTSNTKVEPIEKTVKIKKIVHFSGNKLPLENSFNRKASTLFVPKSPNYPGFDFFIWNISDEVLMAFQVTVQKPFSSHKKIKENTCDKWLDFCYGSAEQKPIEIYWILPESCVGKPKKFKDRIVLLEDLYKDFPALRELSLREVEIV